MKQLHQLWCGDGEGVISVYNEEGEQLNFVKCHEKGLMGLYGTKVVILREKLVVNRC